jgi:hypothetical protein
MALSFLTKGTLSCRRALGKDSFTAALAHRQRKITGLSKRRFFLRLDPRSLKI